MSHPNPYDFAHPVRDGRFFAGRKKLFAWINDYLKEPARPIILYGPRRIGKTSILKQIEGGQFGPAFLTVYIDFAELAMDSLSVLLWELAQTVVTYLRQLKLELDDPRLPDFVADPSRAFQEQCLRPIESKLDGRQLLLLGDNLHKLSQRTERGTLPENSFTTLDQLIHSQPYARCIFTLELTNTGVPELHPFLQDTHNYLIESLTVEEAMTLIREPVRYTVVKDVAQYIYTLTDGHPYDLQQICHTLYERQEEHSLQQITIADVVLVKSFVLKDKPSEFSPPDRLPSYTIAVTPSFRDTFRRPRRPRSPAWSKRGFVALGTAVLLFLITAFGFPNTTIGQQIRNLITPATATPAILAVVSVPTETLAPTEVAAPTLIPTETPAPTETPTPTLTPTETPIPTETPTPSPTPIPTLLVRESDSMPMVLVPGGTFMMGSADDNVNAGDDEKPQHEVTLDSFYIDKYEVSVAQYALFLNDLGGYERACNQIDCAWPRERAGTANYLSIQENEDGTATFMPFQDFGDYPINYVTWYGANNYCQWAGGRLPTEAEWEYAARGTDGRTYPWGNREPDALRAVFNSDSFENIKPVDALPDGASPFGAFAMAGNMWEWVADWYDSAYYSVSPANNPTGPEGDQRVTRGGGWPNNNLADRLRSANRSASSPHTISAIIGFRCAFPLGQ